MPLLNCFSLLIIFCMDLKEGLRMSAYRANLRSVCSDYDMTTVAAFPYLHFALCKYLCHLDVFEKGTITPFVMLLDGAYHAEFCSQLRESLCFRRFCKAIIHVGPLIILTVGGCIKVCRRISDAL